MKKPKEKNNWILFDAKDAILGHLARDIAVTLRGKNKVEFVPYKDVGDFVVVINSSKIKVTGKKMTDKIYYHHSGYLGSLKSQTLKTLLKEHPQDVIKKAISGMLPDNKLKKIWLKKLYIFADDKYPFEDKVRKNA